MYDAEDLKSILPHRYPFLLVDRVLELEPAKSAKAIKNVTFNEPFFQGHFPQKSVMPGVLILEALAQTAGVMLAKGFGLEGAVSFLTGVDKAKIRKMVVPGDQLVMEVQMIRTLGRMGKVSATAKVDDQMVAEAVLSFALSPKSSEDDLRKEGEK